MASQGLSIIRRLAREAAWAPGAVLVLHLVAGALFGHEPFVDPVMHLLGGIAAAFFFRRAASVAGFLLGAPTRLGSDLLAFGLTNVAALFWEIGEFALDQLARTNTQGDLGNTMRDLMFGVTGAALYLVAARFVTKDGADGT
ncbi:MAG TPA: hypothetical protein VGV60_04045 [Candidatus Polarisedimenticolia bacterium]|jgi:hypothetical protein|nr:hypothetical protein [Candidatus Polarisedimenticolia bacterium]